jgi:acetylornithine deacetylase/succinyl-diaminopimelate desuccinylase-like protein
VNALPRTARATVNCRVLPGEPIAEVEATLKRVVGDDRISISQVGLPYVSQSSELRGEVMAAIETLTAEFWPGAAVIPIGEHRCH